MKASTEAESLGGSRLNPKGTRHELVGISWSTGGDEVASGADCTVISGTSATSCRLSTSALASSSCSGPACRGGTALAFVSNARSTSGVPSGPTCPPLGRRRRRLARQPTRCRLLLGHACPASSSVGGEGDGTDPDVALPPRGEDVVDSAAGERAVGRHCRCRTTEEGVSCHSCRRGT